MGIVFDHEFNVVNIVKQYFTRISSKHGEDTHYTPLAISFMQEDIALDDEFLLLNLAIATDNSPLREMFPEYYETTVYDYSSDEFRQRLELHSMINY